MTIRPGCFTPEHAVPAPAVPDPAVPAPATSRRRFLGRALAGTGVALALPALPVAGTPAPARSPGIDRPVVPADAPLEEASFIDPTAKLIHPRRLRLEPRVYVGPFAHLDSGEAPIVIGEESNVQDNVTIDAHRARRRRERDAVAALGLGADDGVEIGPRCILAHGSRVIGPAVIGIGGFDADPIHPVGVFLSFGAEVDGAILEQKCAVSALARVGPGVRLRSGFVVLPGRNVETQSDADDPARGKVRPVVPGDVMFKEAVTEVNTAFAREYTRLYRNDPSAVTGINLDPGGTEFNPERDTPVLAGIPTRDPRFRNRVIGAVTLADSRRRLDDVMGRSIALRADEGEPIEIGPIADMDDAVTFHALEHTAVLVGAGVRFGRGCIVHGGARTQNGVVVENRTVVGDEVSIGDGAVVFRSNVGSGCRLGARSAVVNSRLEPGTEVPPGVIIVDNAVFGAVEWIPR